MHVVIITAVYPPEPVVSARMAFDLACHLAEMGHKVTVVCPRPSRPMGADYSEYVHPEPLTKQEGAIEVVRLPSFTAPRSRLLPRLYESLSFGRHVCRYIATTMKVNPDVVYVNVWPLLAQGLIVRYAKRHRIPVVLQVMDVYPESLLGKLPAPLRGIVFPPLKQIDSLIAHRADRVVVISDSMRKTYVEDRVIPIHRVVTVPTWQDEALFESGPSRVESCGRYRIPADRFTFLYLGNIGPVAGVDLLIRAFHEADIGAAQLLIVGDGSAKAYCTDLVRRLNVPNIHFISDPDASHVPMLQSMAHVCMLPLIRGAGRSSIPSKLPAYLFSAKPVIATVDQDSDTAEVIRLAGCGWVGEPEATEWLTVKMREVAELPLRELEELGLRGKQFGIQHFSRREGVIHLSGVILGQSSAECGRDL